MAQNSSFSIAPLDASKVEDPRGITPYTFTVTRTGDASTAAALAYAVSGSGANPATPADFPGGAVPGGTVSFAPGETSQTITVPVQGSPKARPNEGFTVTLSGTPAGAAITQASADGLIRTDDADTNATAFATANTPNASGGYSRFAVQDFLAAVQYFLAQRAGGATGTVAVSSSPAGPFRPPAPGLANAAVATAPPAGSAIALPSGYAALVAKGANAAALSDAGAAGVLVGTDGGTSFTSSGNGSLLVGGAGSDVFAVSGKAGVLAGPGFSQVFAFGTGEVSVGDGDLTYDGGRLVASFADGPSSIYSNSRSATAFCGAGAVSASHFGGSMTLVGGSGLLTVTKVIGTTTVFGGKGGVNFTANGGVLGVGANTVVGSSGALNFNDSNNGGIQAYTNSIWGYSGQDVIRTAGTSNILAGVSGDKLYSTQLGTHTFLSLTGGVLMNASGAFGQVTFWGGSSGTDTIVCGGIAGSPDSTIVVTGANISTVQLGGGKATVFANGSSAITSGAGSADLVFNDRTQFLLNAVAPGSTRVFALFNFVPGTEHVTLQNYDPNAAAYALANQVNSPGYTTLTLPDQTRILLLGVARAEANVFG